MPREPKRKWSIYISCEPQQDSQVSDRPVKILRKLVNLVSPPTSFMLYNDSGCDMHVQVLQITDGCNTRSVTRQWGNVKVAGVGEVNGPSSTVEHFEGTEPKEREVLLIPAMAAGTSTNICATGKCRIVISYIQPDGTLSVVKRKVKSVNGEDYSILPKVLHGCSGGAGISVGCSLPVSNQLSQPSQISMPGVGSYDSQLLVQSQSFSQTVNGSIYDADSADQVYYDCGIDA
jgi:hypothetical protein